MKLLSLWVITPGELWSQTDTPVNSIDDLKSRKIWALPGTNANIMKAVGAGVVSGPAVQMNEIISRGVVDAYVGVSPTSVRDFRLIPYTKSMTRFDRGIYSTSFSLPDEREEMECAVEEGPGGDHVGQRREVRPHGGGLLGRGRQDRRGRTEKAGIKIVKADPKFEAALIKLGEGLTKKWIADRQQARP